MRKSEDHPGTDGYSDRRDFLKHGLAAAGGVAASSLLASEPASAQATAEVISPPSSIDDEAYWNGIRGHFHIDPEVTYLNNGSLGVCPRPVTQAVYDGYVRMGTYGMEARWPLQEQIREARKECAAYLGASENEVVLTRNATQGLMHIANGIRMNRGDAVLMTTDEHIAGINPWRRRAERFGIDMHHVQIPSPPGSVDEVVALFEEAITPRTKVLFFCHITRGPGLLYPVRELSNMARERGIVSAVDGAQSPGMTPVDLHEMGCDLFATSLHKWSLTPPGTGCLYVREGFQDHFWPLSNGNGPWSDNERALWLVEPWGTHEYPIRAAIRPALSFLHSIGLGNIYARDRMLSDYLKERLNELPGIRLGTSRDHSLSSPGITSFEVEGWDAQLLRGILDGKARIRVSTDQGRNHDMIRVSTHFYNSPAEIDKLIDVFKEIL